MSSIIELREYRRFKVLLNLLACESRCLICEEFPRLAGAMEIKPGYSEFFPVCSICAESSDLIETELGELQKLFLSDRFKIRTSLWQKKQNPFDAEYYKILDEALGIDL